jgi:hypothetical protein
VVLSGRGSDDVESGSTVITFVAGDLGVTLASDEDDGWLEVADESELLATSLSVSFGTTVMQRELF